MAEGNRYDPYSDELSNELPGIVNGKHGDMLFVHVFRYGISSILPPFVHQRGIVVGDFVLVRIRRNPQALQHHTSKHRVQSVMKVRCPTCVRGISIKDDKFPILTVAVKPHADTTDALLLHDDVLGFVVDNMRMVPPTWSNQPNRLVLVVVRIVISPKDQSSSIFSVDKFLRFEDSQEDALEPAISQQLKDEVNNPAKNSIGCIRFFHQGNPIVWSMDFDVELEIDRRLLPEAQLGSWVAFSVNKSANGKPSISAAERIEDQWPMRGGGSVFEVKVLCKLIDEWDNGFRLLDSEVFYRVVDSQNVIKKSHLTLFPMELWVRPCFDEGIAQWEISTANDLPEDNFPSKPKEMMGCIMHADKASCFVWCFHFDEDLLLYPERVMNCPRPLGKWIKFEAKDVMENRGRAKIVGPVTIVPDFLPTQIKYEVPELQVSCTALQRTDPGDVSIFYSDDVGDVADVNGIVVNPDTVTLPFTVWVVKQKGGQNGCRFKISSQNKLIISPSTSVTNVTKPTAPMTNNANHMAGSAQQSSFKKPAPSASELEQMFFQDDGGKYTSDEEENDDNGSSSVVEDVAANQVVNGTKCETTLSTPTVRSNSGPRNSPNSLYQNASLQEMVWAALRIGNVNDTIRKAEPHLHAALLNALLAPEYPPH